MKKDILFVLSLLVLTGCSSNPPAAKQKTETKTVISTTQSTQIPKTDVTFAEDTLTTSQGNIKIIEQKSFIANDGTSVIAVKYSYTNTTNDDENIESLIGKHFKPLQVSDNESKEVNTYQFAPDDPFYNENRNLKENVKPNRTIEIACGYFSENTTVPLSIQVLGDDKKELAHRKIDFITPQIATEDINIEQQTSLQGQLEQAAQDRFWEAKSWGWTDEQASAHADGREFPSAEPVIDANNDAVVEADRYREEFYQEHGREPSSGEMQSKWLKDQGIID